MAAIRVQGLSFDYGKQKILHDINLDIETGRFSVILGRNGSGKSTLFRILAGFLKPVQGRVRVNGQSLKSMRNRERARIMGFLPQHHRPVFPFLSEDVVITGRAGHIRFSPSQEDRWAALSAMQRVGIEHLKGKMFTELSGGEQQLVMIARVVAQDPKIILLDEPISHLDFFYQIKVLQLVRELARDGYTIAAILHDPNIATLYGERFICIEKGKIVQLPSPDQLDKKTLEAVYGMPLETTSYHNKILVIPPGGESQDSGRAAKASQSVATHTGQSGHRREKLTR